MRQTSHNNRRGGGRPRNYSSHQGGREFSDRNNFDSNGPNVRVRGKALQVYEKYINLARDASTNGDRVLMENLFQHAEHYIRLVNDMNEGAATPPSKDSTKDNGSNGTRRGTPPHIVKEGEKQQDKTPEKIAQQEETAQKAIDRKTGEAAETPSLSE